MKDFKLSKTNEEKSILKTIRIKMKTLEKIEKLSRETDLSINKIINECIEYALNNLVDEEIDKRSS